MKLGGCCCFLGRIAEQIRRCRRSSRAAAKLNCQDCCQNSLSSQVDLVGVASFPCREYQRCSADSDTCGQCCGLHTESLSVRSLHSMSPSHRRGWDRCRSFALCVGKARPCRAHGLPMQEPSQASCPPGVKGLIPMFPGGLCDLLTPSGHRAGRKSKDALGMNKEAGMKPYGRTGDSSCPGSVLVHVSRGSSVLFQREKDVGHATSSFWRV